MILPSKGVTPELALLTVGADVLTVLDQPRSVSVVWHQVKTDRHSRGGESLDFDWFVLALDLLRALGAISLTERGLLVKVT